MFDYFPIDANEFDGPVLVTGSGGCIGSWTVALLEHAGVKVHAFDLMVDKRRPGLLMNEAALNNVVWHAGDIVDTAAVKTVVEKSGVRAIIHLAALQVPFCRADPVAGALVNVVGTVNVFEAAKACGISRLTYASSVAAYGALEDGGAMSTLYGAYKYCNEQTAKVYSEENGLHSVGIRPGVVYGVGRDQGMTSKTTAAILAAAANKPYVVPFSGDVSWLFAGEAASAFIRSVAKAHAGAPVFDLAAHSATLPPSCDKLPCTLNGAVSNTGDSARNENSTIFLSGSSRLINSVNSVAIKGPCTIKPGYPSTLLA
ncbi:MAG: SDR family oxidoreductase [Oxalobacteraceae bacterium]|nr:SDR family oxidoreductase [Oxalobacteraceae bacterium]